ncbi:MAG: hypothetical protein AMJ53_04905 [Gammaproteobacteria bacterium SG8_11]|nr:MAG: hypothetical protein AMJ53_04905 [Gammaproteobacteria bacterium SG8_11]
MQFYGLHKFKLTINELMSCPGQRMILSATPLAPKSGFFQPRKKACYFNRFLPGKASLRQKSDYLLLMPVAGLKMKKSQ